MGDMNSRNLSEMKAYSKVEVQIDMLALYKFAYDEVEGDLAGYDGFSFSDIAAPAEAPVPTFTENIANSLLDGYKQGITVWDEFQWQELDSFKATLLETIEEEKLQKKKTESLDPMPGFINDLIGKVHKSVTIDTSPAITTNYLTLFMDKLKGKVNELFVDSGGLFFDAIQLKLVPKGSDVAKMYASSNIDLSCFDKVMGLDHSDTYAYYGSSDKCYPKTYVA